MSDKYSLDTFDWKKVLIGAGVAGTGALLTYITQVVTNLEPGIWTPIIVSAWSIFANIVRKWLEGKLTPTAEEFNSHTEDPN